MEQQIVLNKSPLFNFQTVTLLLQEELAHTECCINAKQCDTLPTA